MDAGHLPDRAPRPHRTSSASPSRTFSDSASGTGGRIADHKIHAEPLKALDVGLDCGRVRCGRGGECESPRPHLAGRSGLFDLAPSAANVVVAASSQFACSRFENRRRSNDRRRGIHQRKDAALEGDRQRGRAGPRGVRPSSELRHTCRSRSPRPSTTMTVPPFSANDSARDQTSSLYEPEGRIKVV